MSIALVNPGMRPDTITLETNMGRVVTAVRIENIADLYEVVRGQRADEDVRRVEVSNALVDTGCTSVGLPSRLVKELALTPLSKRSIRGATGNGETTVYGTVRITIDGRDCATDVFEIPDDLPVLIGQVPLELLDFVVDPKNQKLIGNPLHGGEHVIEAY
jgi:clan AA aspartic protease